MSSPVYVATSVVDRSTIREVAIRLVPFIALVFVIDYLDRTAIGFADSAAAAGIALIDGIGNLAGFSAGYVTGWVPDASSGHEVPMLLAGGFTALSGVRMLVLAGRGRVPTRQEPLATPDVAEKSGTRA